MVRVAAVAAVVLLGCTSASTDTSDATANGPQPVSTVTTRLPSTSIATTTTVAEPTTSLTSSTTTPIAPSTPTSEATLEPPVFRGLVLQEDGLGLVSFDDPMSDTVATLTDLLGTPSDDRVEEAPFGEEGEMGGGMMACWTATGTTCIDYLRVVGWDTIGLFVVFSDWIESAPAGEDWEPAPAPPNLRGYAYFGRPGHLVLSTEGGVTIGSTVDDLVGAYGSNLRFSFDECAFNVAGFEVVAPAGSGGNEGRNSGASWGLWGELSDVPDAAETVVISIGGGTLLGHC